MRNLLKFILALVIAFLLMLAFRSLAFTIYEVPSPGIKSHLIAGDRVIVNRWSYGLRTGGEGFFSYSRWISSPVEKGDLVVFNFPLDTIHDISDRAVYAGYCDALPGDTVRIGSIQTEIPGKGRIIKVDSSNIKMLCNIYILHEKRKAHIQNGKLYVDGKEVSYCCFKNNYYWISSRDGSNQMDSRYFGPLPESHIIGRMVMLVYSKDAGKPFYSGFRDDRWFIWLND